MPRPASCRSPRPWSGQRREQPVDFERAGRANCSGQGVELLCSNLALAERRPPRSRPATGSCRSEPPDKKANTSASTSSQTSRNGRQSATGGTERSGVDRRPDLREGRDQFGGVGRRPARRATWPRYRPRRRRSRLVIRIGQDPYPGLRRRLQSRPRHSPEGNDSCAAGSQESRSANPGLGRTRRTAPG